MIAEAPRVSWRTVPEPRRIRSRVHERHGYPVPFVAQSEGESESVWSRIGTRDDGPLEGLQLMSHGGWKRSGTDTPATARAPWLLGQMNEERQRLCQLQPRCQVCGLPLSPKGPRLHVAGDASYPPGEAAVLFREPPLCEPCALYAVQVCPALVGARGSNVTLYTVTEHKIFVEGLLVTPTDHRTLRLPLEVARVTPHFAVLFVFVAATQWTAVGKAQYVAERAGKPE